jgi:hypothetical protein
MLGVDRESIVSALLNGIESLSTGARSDDSVVASDHVSGEVCEVRS